MAREPTDGELFDGGVGRPHPERQIAQCSELLDEFKILDPDCSTGRICAQARNQLRARGQFAPELGILLAGVAPVQLVAPDT